MRVDRLIGRDAAKGAWVCAGLALGMMPAAVMADAAQHAGAEYIEGHSWTNDPAGNAGGEAVRVTLEGAVQEALSWHPSLAEAIGKLNASGEEIAEAKAGYRPQLEAGVNGGYDSALRNGWRPRANISASQMLYDFGKVGSAVARAEAGVHVREAQVLQAVDNLIRDTSYAVIEIQRSVALHQVALDQLASLENINRLVRHRFEKGAATRSDALQALARVQAAEATIQEIEAERERWSSTLLHLLGRRKMPDVMPGMPEWLDQSCARGEPDWSAIPAIMEAQGQRDEAVAELDRARADGLPTVSVGAGTSADISAPFSGRTDYNFGLNVSSSLYSGGSKRARTRGATYALGAADAAEAKVRNEVSRQLTEAQRQIAGYTAVAGTLSAREVSMRETGKLYRLQYLDMGTRTLVDLLNAEQELHQVRFTLTNTRHDIHRLNVDCLFHAGAEREAFGLGGIMLRGVKL